MKTKIFAGLLIAAAAHTALAVTPTKPNACPSISAIKSVGINEARKEEDGGAMWYSFIRKNSFGTNVEWEFILRGDFNTQKSSEAIKMANASLSSMNTISEPVLTEDNGKEAWACAYFPSSADQTHGYLMGLALSPADWIEIPAIARIISKMR